MRVTCNAANGGSCSERANENLLAESMGAGRSHCRLLFSSPVPYDCVSVCMCVCIRLGGRGVDNRSRLVACSHALCADGSARESILVRGNHNHRMRQPVCPARRAGTHTSRFPVRSALITLSPAEPETSARNSDQAQLGKQHSDTHCRPITIYNDQPEYTPPKDRVSPVDVEHVPAYRMCM